MKIIEGMTIEKYILALPLEVSSRHMSGGLAYKQGQQKKVKLNPACHPANRPESVNASTLLPIDGFLKAL